MLLRILRWGAVLFAIPWAAGTWAAVEAEMWTFAATATGAYAVVLALAFAPALGFRLRAAGLLVTCWGVGLAVVLLVGPMGAGALWLATVPVLATFLFGTRGAAWGMLAVTLTVAGLALIAAGPTGLGPPDGVGPGIRYDLFSWLANAGSIVGLGALLSVPFAVLLGRASRSLEREREARLALEEEAGRREVLESRLREAHKMEALGTFAGGVAHDFNNLLVPLLSDAEAIVAEAAPGSPARESARRIERAAIRARELVRGILSFSRDERGATEHVLLGPLMEEVARLLDASASDDVRVTVEVDPATPALVGDPTLVHQLLVNLVTNARLALAESGGEIRLEAWPEGGKIAVVRVSDTGVGMDEATRQRAFDPFFTTRPAGSGTGLGLSTVLGTVRGMGGEIRLDSAPGQGTKVELRLPVPDAPPLAGPVPDPDRGAKETRAEPAPRPLRVLLVDDDRMVRAAAYRLLVRIGHTVEEAPGGQEALAALEATDVRNERIDVVLTDRTMPGMDGLTLARIVNERWPELPVVLVTGDLHGAVGAGSGLDPPAPTFAAVLSKPFRREELARTLQAAVQPEDPGAGSGNSPPGAPL